MVLVAGVVVGAEGEGVEGVEPAVVSVAAGGGRVADDFCVGEEGGGGLAGGGGHFFGGDGWVGVVGCWWLWCSRGGGHFISVGLMVYFV